MKNNKNISNKELSIAKHQLGLSLIELLVAMLIGLFLLVGITTSYLSSKKSSISRDQVSILEDNGRAALEVLRNTLQHTGYRSSNLVALENPFMINGQPNSVSCGTGNESVVAPGIFPNPVISGGNTTGDTIGITYLGDGNLNTDCSGRVLPTQCRIGANVALEAHQIHNAFFVDADADDTQLICVGSRSSEQVLIAEGVENLQVLYGIDVDGDVDKTVDRYVASDLVGDDWGKVVSLQVAILVRTATEVKNEPEIQSFTLLGTEVISPRDRFQRAVFNASIQLRNL